MKLKSMTKYQNIQLSNKVAKKLGALAPGESHDLQSWAEETLIMHDQDKKRGILDMGTSCHLSPRTMKAIWDCKKDWTTER